MQRNAPTVAAAVVTYNRKALLGRCLSAIAGQSRRPDRILVVDNASTDGTRDALSQEGWLQHPGVELLALRENTGGAGGFAAAIERATRMGTDWIWLMDDDAEPHPDALEELLRIADSSSNVYGSLATCGTDTSWITTLTGPPRETVTVAERVPACAPVQSLPFLGFMIHRNLVQKIGLPDAGFFIAADDIEYCARAQQSGANIIIAGKSRIEHPKSHPYRVRVLGRTLTCLALPPWKRYYDTRNRLLIARRYYGLRLLTETIPGSLVRLVAALITEPRKSAQLWAFIAGFIDGLLGFKGMRHTKWKIAP